MADGRQLIEETRDILLDVSARTGDPEGTYTDEERAELERYLEDGRKWVKLCRKKVWLRGQEGTGRAQACLDVAVKLQNSLAEAAVAVEAAADLSQRLDSLARLIATKAQVLT